MKKARPGTMMYFDLLYDLEDYTDAEVGQLTRAMLKYGLTGELPGFTDRSMKTMWRTLQKKVDLDADKYDKKLLQTKYATYCKKVRATGAEPISYEEWINEHATDDNDSLRLDNENERTDNDSSTDVIQLPTTNSQQPPVSSQQLTANNQHTASSVQQSYPNDQQFYPAQKPQVRKSKRDEEFESFWQAYPKKKNKADARKAFDKVKVPLQTLLDAIDRQKRSAQWSKDGGQFIPYPASWLNKGAWDDEPEVESGSYKYDVDAWREVEDSIILV